MTLLPLRPSSPPPPHSLTLVTPHRTQQVQDEGVRAVFPTLCDVPPVRPPSLPLTGHHPYLFNLFLFPSLLLLSSSPPFAKVGFCNEGFVA